ncbi:MAG TPA: M20/M25/M40 family metallo-hydrolase [Firmicutes bacterium]|nr:M20/M25/M40 family metallo-hydrolase [Bacillota bacterium]
MTKRLIETFIEFVQIASESGHEEEFLLHLAERFGRDFGAECRRDRYGNLVARIPGRRSKVQSPLLLGVHADTVAPGCDIRPVIEGDVIRSDGRTVLGADDKAGIAEVFEAVKRADRFPPLEIVVTREEECGMQGARHLDFSLLQARQGYVLDMDSVDSIVVGGPTKLNLEITVHGRAAHAGMEPEKGVSAIKAASLAIVRLPDGRIDPVTTWNVGTIHGGENRNSVPERVFMQGEVRSLDHEKCVAVAERVRKAFEEAAASIGAVAEVVVSTAYRAVNIPSDAEVVRAAAEAIQDIGLTPRILSIVGGTDASVYNEHGIQTAVLGIGVRNEHTRSEHIGLADMERAVEILVRILRHFAGE